MTIRHHPVAALLAAAALLPAAQAETGPYYIGGLVSQTHQSNVLGLADGAAVPTGLGYTSKADNVTSLALVGGIDQTISRQRLFGDVTLRHNRYADNTLLNNNGYALTAGVDWETVDHLSGNVTVKSNRDLFRYSVIDQPSGVKNLVSSRQADALARLGGVTPLTFEAGAGYRSVDYSDASYDGRDNHQSYWLLGARYAPARGAWVGLSLRETRGQYPRLQVDPNTGSVTPDRLRRRDVDLYGTLEVSGLTNLYARISQSRIDYDLQPDFSGVTALLRVNWQPTAKLRLTAEAARDRGQDLRFVLANDVFFGQTVAETAQLVTAFRTRASLEVSAKVSADANIGYTRRPVTLFNNQLGASESGREATRQYGIGARWTPTRTSLVGCDLSHEQRSSDLVSVLNLSSNSFGCYAQLTLQP